MKAFWYSLLLIAVGIIVLFIWHTIHPAVRPSPQAKTSSRIYGCYFAMLNRESEVDSTATFLKRAQTNGVGLNRAVAILVAHPERDLEDLQQFLTNDLNLPMVLDAWSRPFIVEWKDNVAASFPVQKSNWPRCPVLVWSSGPNGINENGQGDDITSLGQEN